MQRIRGVTKQDSLEELLDRGLEAISAGQTIDEFLARHGSYTKKLEPLLLQAEALRRGFVGEPRPEAIAITRNTLLGRFDELRDSGTFAASRLDVGRSSFVLLGSLAACLLLALVSAIAHLDSARPDYIPYPLTKPIDSFQVLSRPQNHPGMLVYLREANKNAAALSALQTPALTEGPDAYGIIIELTQKILAEAETSGISESVAIQLLSLADQEAKLSLNLLGSQLRDTAAVGERLLSLANDLVRIAGGTGQPDKGTDQKQSTTPQPSGSREADPPLAPVASDVAVAAQSQQHPLDDVDTSRGPTPPSNNEDNPTNKGGDNADPAASHDEGSNTTPPGNSGSDPANKGGGNNVSAASPNHGSNTTPPGNNGDNPANKDGGNKVPAASPNNGNSATPWGNNGDNPANKGGGNNLPAAAPNNGNSATPPGNSGGNRTNKVGGSAGPAAPPNNGSAATLPSNGGGNPHAS